MSRPRQQSNTDGSWMSVFAVHEYLFVLVFLKGVPRSGKSQSSNDMSHGPTYKSFGGTEIMLTSHDTNPGATPQYIKTASRHNFLMSETVHVDSNHEKLK